MEQGTVPGCKDLGRGGVAPVVAEFEGVKDFREEVVWMGGARAAAQG